VNAGSDKRSTAGLGIGAITLTIGFLTCAIAHGADGPASAPKARASMPEASASVPEAEENDIATLPPIGPHWGFITNWVRGGIRIVDGDSGKLLGTIYSAQLSDFATDPAGNFYYVAETMWTRGNRGTRQDLLTVYDARTLKMVSEIAIPGRLLIGNRPLNLTISPDGAYAFVYNLDPATSIQVVDLVKRRLAITLQVPGCGLAIAGSGGVVASLCSDGSMVTAFYNTRKAGTPTRGRVFFDAESDPIFDNSFVDFRNGRALFMTYSGLVYEVSLGPTPLIGEPWSIQMAAGLSKGSTQPLQVSWLPGGREPIAFNRDSGKAYVLMHMGELWSQKAAGSELWEVDVAARKVLRRKHLEVPIAAVAVTQGAHPLLFLNNETDELIVLDVADFEQKHSLANAGNGIISVAGN
jgi:methylamine dehydrogenase heavy chain